MCKTIFAYKGKCKKITKSSVEKKKTKTELVEKIKQI